MGNSGTLICLERFVETCDWVCLYIRTSSSYYYYYYIIYLLFWDAFNVRPSHLQLVVARSYLDRAQVLGDSVELDESSCVDPPIKVSKELLKVA